jgi:phytoene desaturase
MTAGAQDSSRGGAARTSPGAGRHHSVPTVAVIGAGIGGMASAAHLARMGFRVTVFERNQRPGGRCDRIERDGHVFDTGPTLFIMPDVYAREYAYLGENLHAHLDLLRVDPSYHVIFDDGTDLSLTSDLDSMRQQLEAIEPGSFKAYLEYLSEGHRHYDMAMAKLVDRDFRRPADFFKLSNLPLAVQVKPFVNHYRHMGAYVHSPRLKAAFTFQDVYMGLSPFEAPATFSMMPYTEFAHGVWYPRGGMGTIVNSFFNIAMSAGVRFEFNQPVAKIPVEGRRALGVTLRDGETIPFDFILANADLPYVYKELLPDRALSQKLEGKAYSCSVISFFWGLDTVVESLPPHSLFLVDDYRRNFEDLSRPGSFPHHPSIYLHAPARLDPSMAPPGRDTLIGIVPVAHLNGGESHVAQNRDLARQAIFDRLTETGFPEIESHIKLETSFTPLSWQRRYNLVNGSTHGLSHTLRQLAYFRPSNRHPRYANLYFVGASTRPGTGIPTTLISARLTATRLADEHGLAHSKVTPPRTGPIG